MASLGSFLLTLHSVDESAEITRNSFKSSQALKTQLLFFPLWETGKWNTSAAVYVQQLSHWNSDAARAGESDLTPHAIYTLYLPQPDASQSPLRETKHHSILTAKSTENLKGAFIPRLWGEYPK